MLIMYKLIFKEKKLHRGSQEDTQSYTEVKT